MTTLHIKKYFFIKILLYADFAVYVIRGIIAISPSPIPGEAVVAEPLLWAAEASLQATGQPRAPPSQPQGHQARVALGGHGTQHSSRPQGHCTLASQHSALTGLWSLVTPLLVLTCAGLLRW